MLRRVACLSVLSLSVGCGLFGGKGTSSDGGGNDDPPSNGSTTKEVEATDADGVVTGAMTANSTDTQLLKASASSDIAGSSVAFPPGSLAIDVSVTVEQGVSLDTDGLESALGVTSGSLSAAGPAVVVSSDPKTNGVSPFSVSLVTTQSAGLLGTTYIVVFKSYDADTGLLTIGVIPTGDIKAEGNTLTINTKKFGVYQAFLTTEEITALIEKATTEPIKTEREEKKKTDDAKEQEKPGDKTAPVFKSIDLAVPGIEATQTFRVTFDEAMDPAKAEVGGTMVASGKKAAVTVAKSVVDGDTLVVAPPEGGWVLGEDLTLSVTAKDKSDNAAAPVVRTFDVVSSILYVHKDGKTEAQSATGTKDNPYNNIREAVSKASTTATGKYVYVAAGTYTETFSLSKGSRVVGGFAADKTWGVSDPKSHVVVIEGITSGPTGDPNSVVIFGNQFPNDVPYALLEGFTINGAVGTFESELIKVDDVPYLVKIQHNQLTAKGIEKVYAITAAGADLFIYDNRIVSVADNGSVTDGGAIMINNLSLASVTIANNFIKGADISFSGIGADAVGMFAKGFLTPSDLRIHDNVIVSGQRSGNTGEARALWLEDANSEIRNNTIVAQEPSSGSANGIFIEGSSQDNIVENNAIVVNANGSGFGIRLDSRFAGGLASVRNNAFKFYASTLFPDPPQPVYGFATVATFEASAVLPQVYSGNLGDSLSDPGFVDQATLNFRLLSAPTASPLIGAGLEGNAETPPWDFGLGGFFNDLDGKPRGSNWSIGAYQ